MKQLFLFLNPIRLIRRLFSSATKATIVQIIRIASVGMIESILPKVHFVRLRNLRGIGRLGILASQPDEENTDARVDLVLDELDRLARSKGSPAHFYNELLGRLKILLGANDCFLVCRFQSSHWRVIASTSSSIASEPERQLTQVLSQLRLELPLHWVENADLAIWLGCGLNGTDWSAGGIVAKLPLASSNEKAKEVSAKDNHPFSEVVFAFAELAFSYQLRREFADQEKRSAEIRSVITSILASQETREADQSLVDGARFLIDSDRVSLLQWKTGTANYEPVAISGLRFFDTKSKIVDSIKRLTLSIPQLDFNEQLVKLASESESTIALAYPIRTKPNAVVANPEKRFVLILEWFESERYVQKASNIASVMPWITDAWQSRPRSMNETIWKNKVAKRTLACMFLLGVILFLVSPTELTIQSSGTLQPMEQRFVFAPTDGYIDRVFVADGQSVKSGDILAAIGSPQLQLQINQVSSEIDLVDQKQDGFNLTLNQLKSSDDPGNLNGSRLAGEVQELEAKKRNLIEQKTLLDREQNRLQLRSPIDGNVIAWEVEMYLENRPVRRGDTLLRIAALDEQWQIESTVVDWESGYVIDAYRAGSDFGRDLSVEFVLASSSGERHAGKIKRMSNTMRDVNGAQQLDLVVQPDSNLEQPRLGTSVTISIHCGRFPRWFVWTRSVLDAVRRRFWF